MMLHLCVHADAWMATQRCVALSVSVSLSLSVPHAPLPRWTPPPFPLRWSPTRQVNASAYAKVVCSCAVCVTG